MYSNTKGLTSISNAYEVICFRAGLSIQQNYFLLAKHLAASLTTKDLTVVMDSDETLYQSSWSCPDGCIIFENTVEYWKIF